MTLLVWVVRVAILLSMPAITLEEPRVLFVYSCLFHFSSCWFQVRCNCLSMDRLLNLYTVAVSGLYCTVLVRVRARARWCKNQRYCSIRSARFPSRVILTPFKVDSPFCASCWFCFDAEWCNLSLPGLICICKYRFGSKYMFWLCFCCALVYLCLLAEVRSHPFRLAAEQPQYSSQQQ